MRKILCIAQQKGGVCKTTATLSISAALAIMGEKVLMLDTDPQANLTRNIIDYNSIKNDITSLYKNSISIKELVTPTPYENLFIIPSKPSLSGVENMERKLSTYNALKKSIPEIGDKFKYIIIDTPPSLGLFTVSALLAATHVLVPVQPAFFCQEGLGDLNVTIKEARENNNNLLSVRFFITLYDRRTIIGQDLVKLLRSQLKNQIFDTHINKNIAIEESQYAQKTIFDYDSNSRGARDFMNLSKEVRKWLEKKY